VSGGMSTTTGLSVKPVKLRVDPSHMRCSSRRGDVNLLMMSLVLPM
jgi:hypothetical protein